MTHTEIVRKLIGPIDPIGKTEVDNQRYENLQALCELVNNLVGDIDRMAYQNRDAKEFSVKRSAEFGAAFLTDTIGIAD